MGSHLKYIFVDLCFLSYSALLWHRLMGRRVLLTTFYGTKKIRTYAHCAKESVSEEVLCMYLYMVGVIYLKSDVILSLTERGDNTSAQLGQQHHS